MNSATRSAIIMVVTLVLARTTSGMIDASATRRPATPRTRSLVSTTAMASSSGPILQVPEMWYDVLMLRRSHASSASLDSRSDAVGAVISSMTSSYAVCCSRDTQRRTASRSR